jgi:uncharacterized protein
MEKVDAILAACKRGDIDEVERLLKADATLATASTMLGSQPIHAAYLGGHGAIVELLLSRGVQIDFFLASELGMLDRVKQALDTDQKFALAPNPSDEEDVVLQLVSMLIAGGAEVNGHRRDGLTALHSAGYRGHRRVIELLLRHGADPSIQGYEGSGPHAGQTAFDMAIAQGQVEAITLLRQQ